MLNAEVYIDRFRRLTRGRAIWRRNALAFERFLRRWLASNPPAEGAGAGSAVVVQPWLMTAVPWYSIALGLFLARRTGKAVTFLCDDLPFGNEVGEWQAVLDSIRKILTLVGGRFSILWLSDFSHPAAETLQPSSRSRRLAELNAIWFLRGETKQEGREQYRALAEAQLRRAEAGIARLLAQHRFDYLVVAGGVYSSSGVWREIAREKGVRVATFDGGGPGALVIATDGVASQLADIPRAFRSLWAEPPLRKAMLAQAQAERARRYAGTDAFHHQFAPPGSCLTDMREPIVLAPNTPWDTAALGLHKVFENSADWLVETVRWALSNSASTVVVRQHPGERLKIGRSNDNYAQLLNATFGQHERLKFVGATDPVNTYDLVERAKVVVVHTSTVGVEAAAMGKTVLTASDPYYAALGFVLKAGDRAQYFDLLEQALAGRTAASQEQADAAMCCYYLGQCCNWVWSEFSPESLDKWANMRPEDVYHLGAVQDMLTAIDTNVPYAVLRCASQIDSPVLARP